MLDYLQSHPLQTAVFTGLILGFSITSGWWPLTIIGCLLWYGGLRNMPFLQIRTVFYYGSLFGISKMLVVLAWGIGVYPLAWLGSFSFAQVVGLIILYGTVAAISIGLATGLLTAAAYYCTQRSLHILILSICLVGAEVLGSFLYALVFSGAGSFIQAYFSFGYVGYGLASSSYFLPFASIGGVYILSLYTYSISFLLYEAWHRHSWKISVIVIAMLLAPTTITTAQTSHEDTTVALIDTEFTSKTPPTVTHLALQEAVTSALQTPASHIVLPEDSRFVAGFPSRQAAATWMSSQTNSSSVYLYDSGRSYVSASTIMRGQVLQANSNNVGVYDKEYLVPQGEFIPYFSELLIRMSLDSSAEERLRDHLSYRPSSHTNYPSNWSVAPFLFCFEAVNPFGVSLALKRHQHSFIVHPVSHSWFETNAPGLRNQLLIMLQVQAVWNNVPILIAGNKFSGGVIRADGTIDDGTVIQTTPGWTIRTVEL